MQKSILSVLVITWLLAGCTQLATSMPPAAPFPPTDPFTAIQPPTSTATQTPPVDPTPTPTAEPTATTQIATPGKALPSMTPTQSVCGLQSQPRDPVAAVTEVMPVDGERCQIHLPTVARYPGDRLGGYTLTYPQSLQAQVNGWEELAFSPWYLTVTRTRTDLPPESIDQARVPYEFLTLPVVGVQDTRQSNHGVQFGNHSVVVMDSEVRDVLIRRYFVLSRDRVNGQADLLVFTLWNYPTADQAAERDLAVEAEVEQMIAALRFDAPETAVINMTGSPDLPTAEPAAPAGVLVARHEEGETLSVLSPGGKRLDGFSVPGLKADAEIRVAGPWTGSGIDLPLLTYNIIPSTRQRLYVHQGDQVVKEIDAPFLAFVNRAPGQPYIAYTTIDWYYADLYFGRLADFPNDPVINRTGYENVPYPYAFALADDRSPGLWITVRSYGIGNFVFLLDHGLDYYDLAIRTTREVLPRRVGTLGLSPDFSRVAYYSSIEQQVVILSPGEQQETRFDLVPWDDLAAELAQVTRDEPLNYHGAAGGQFSPDNQYFAWIEALTYADSSIGWGYRPRARLRVADLSQATQAATGQTRVNLLDAAFTDTAGFQPDTIEPVGWVDHQTLLLQVSAFGHKGKTALLAFHVADGSTTLFSPGRFVDFVYSGE